MNIWYVHEESVYFTVGGYIALQVANRSSWLIVFQIFYIYTNFYLFVLAIIQREWQNLQLLWDICLFLHFFSLFLGGSKYFEAQD